MKAKIFLCFIHLVLLCSVSKAQLIENFNDGDFTNSPVWSGGAANFIVNSSLQLQSNNTASNSTFFLSTPNSLAGTAQWEWFTRVAFNPSSANYIDVYLTASASDLALNTTTGYFVRIGNTDDEISLYRKDTSGVVTKIIDGTNSILNNSNNVMKIKVIRDASNKWILNRDLTGTGNNYINEGFFVDATYTTSAFFGFLIKQSTSSFFQRHYFDDIEIKNYLPDTDPPSIKAIDVISPNAVDLVFNEAMDTESGKILSNYSADNNLGSPVAAVVDGSNPSLIHLTFSSVFTNGTIYTLTVRNVKDVSGNEISNAAVNFSLYTPQRYDVVIDEVMADPIPQVGLPAIEWVELKNTSSFSINLQGWKLSDLTGQTGPLPNFILPPDSFIIVCPVSAVSSLSPFGKVLGVAGFPSLDNDGDLVSVYSSTGKTMHAVQYSSSWYQNELKKAGGWTLEMIDTKNPCAGFSNWKGSNDAGGGTPGKKNSVNGINADKSAPKLMRAFATTSTKITLVFDEPLDSLAAAAAANYVIDNGISVVSAVGIPPIFNNVNIALDKPITGGTLYNVTVANVNDCRGNVIGLKNTARFGLPDEADSMDIVINEILYNPKPQGVDYVEVYNRSKKIIDLSHIYIANRSSNEISNIRQVTVENMLLFPGDFMVITTDASAVKTQYITTTPDAFISVASMPSFPNNGGNVIILNGRGNIVDEVAYSDKWQFPLITNAEGVSLERIDYNGSSIQKNFHSAATSVGYGTPGYKNSQYRLNEVLPGEVKVSPDIFSPDNDGTDDFATIDYSFPSPGYVVNITIFDASGRPVRYLERNALSGIKGYYRWDGLDDKNGRLSQGVYIIYTEIFNTAGKRKQFKNAIVLARRF